MIFNQRRHKDGDTSESGFVLILSLVVLLVLTLLGIWALNTSTFELRVAGTSQQAERQFNITEGAAYLEAGKVGFFLPPFDTFPNPGNTGWRMLPINEAGFDPGNDTEHTLAEIQAILPIPPTTTPGFVPLDNWPWQNLINNNAASANEFDYRYLVTYLECVPTAPMGTGSETNHSFNFQVQGAAPLVVELGGTKLGPPVCDDF